MRTVQSIAFDFSVHGVTPRIYGKQGDVNSRFVNISLFDQGAAWLVPDGALLSIRFRTPSGASGLYDTLSDGSSAFEVSDNTVCVALAEPIFAESGPVRCELSIAAENAGVTTWCFIVAVEGASVSDQEIPEDYYNGFLSVAAQVAADAKRAEDAANSVDTTLLMNKTMYDPAGAVEAAGGIPQYVAQNAPKTTVLDSVTSTSTTAAASAAAVKKAYDRAEDYLDSQKGNANGVASLNASGLVPDNQIGYTSGDLSVSVRGSYLTLVSNRSKWYKYGRVAVLYIDATVNVENAAYFSGFFVAGYPKSSGTGHSKDTGAICDITRNAVRVPGIMRATSFTTSASEQPINIETLADGAIVSGAEHTVTGTIMYLVV